MRSILAILLALGVAGLAGSQLRVDAQRDGPITVSGTIVAKRQFHVNAKVSGQVREIYAQEGDEVKAGQDLAALDATEFELAFKRSKVLLERAQALVAKDEAELRSAEDRIKMAEATVRQTMLSFDIMRSKAQRYREMFNKQAMDEGQVVEADNEVKKITAQIDERKAFAKALKELPQREQLRISKAELALAEADLTQARYRLDSATVRAPCKGVVLSRHVARGDIVGGDAAANRPTREMFVIADLSNVAVMAEVSDRNLNHFHTGQRCEVFCDLPNPTVVTGQVIRMAPELSAQTRTSTIQVRLDPLSKESEIRPGMFVRVCIPARE